jgi:hypothetical protein
MPTLMQPSAATDFAMNLETVIEAQDERWVVIVRYLEQGNVARARTRSFPTYPQARQYEAELKAGQDS